MTTLTLEMSDCISGAYDVAVTVFHVLKLDFDIFIFLLIFLDICSTLRERELNTRMWSQRQIYDRVEGEIGV